MRSINFRLGIAAVVVAVLYLLSPEANAQIAVGVHVGSVHSNQIDGVSGRKWNNNNPGLYVRYDNFVVGTYFNSIRKESYYVAYVYPVTSWLDVSLGAISGYNGPGYAAKPVMPMVVPSVHFDVGHNVAARIHLAPKVSRGGATAIHLSLEYRL